MNSFQYHIAVVGGGIVGLATAMHVSRRYPDARVVLLEKEPRLGQHQTGHNSGVIHSGIYYPPGSLKAKLCVEGARAMAEFAEHHRIPYELCGKIIVATQEQEIPRLHALLDRGKANGVGGLELLDQKGIKRHEPNANGLLGIFSPHTGIINYQIVAEAMAKQVIKNGGEVMTHSKVVGIKSTDEGHVIRTDRGEVLARFLINCAGLYSDAIARLMGVKTDVRIVPFRGEYYWVRKERQSLVRNLIYPVPDPNLPFLGVHFTRTLDGKLDAGPNAVLAFAREGYSPVRVDFSELGEMIADARFWKMIRRYWKMGIFEFYRAWSKKYFAKALQALVPEIREEDLEQGPTGVRAQCIDQNGTLVNDFKIVEAPRSIHVLNVPSPAATASLTIGDYIVKLAAKSFSLAGQDVKLCQEN